MCHGLLRQHQECVLDGHQRRVDARCGYHGAPMDYRLPNSRVATSARRPASGPWGALAKPGRFGGRPVVDRSPEVPFESTSGRRTTGSRALSRCLLPSVPAGSGMSSSPRMKREPRLVSRRQCGDDLHNQAIVLLTFAPGRELSGDDQRELHGPCRVGIAPLRKAAHRRAIKERRRAAFHGAAPSAGRARIRSPGLPASGAARARHTACTVISRQAR
jgi:hypothetical protein